MTIDIVPVSLYPLVPQLPGVPAVLRSTVQRFDTATLGFLGLGNILNGVIGTDPVRWGIFDSAGAPIASYDSVYSVHYDNDSKISDYPVEQGGFSSYNKVETPFDAVVALNCGGNDARRSAFQVAIEAARKSLQLYSVLTPEFTYLSCNITGIGFSRECTDGAYIVKAILRVREVRQQATSSFSATQDASAADPQSQGQVQTVDDPSIDASGVA